MPRILIICLICLLTSQIPAIAEKDMLKGSVQKEDALMRIERPSNNQGASQSNSLRLSRPSTSPLTGLVDTSKFSNPSSDNLRSDAAHLGLVQPNNFQSLSANKFDLGADRGSRELLIAWERWYKQLSGAIYTRWSQVADVPGHAVVRITVTKDRELRASMVRSSGDRDFDHGLMDAIMSLDKNPGLTFPGQSQRKLVSLESDYIAGTNIEPGYNWVRNDVERVQESY